MPASAITTDNTQTSGTSAATNEARKNSLATWFLIRRRRLTGETPPALTGTVKRVDAHPLTFPPAIVRAAALTMNVRTKSANPAEM